MSRRPPVHLVPTTSRVDPAARREVFGHAPATVWFTGLSGSGKSTLAYALEAHLIGQGVAAYVLDGDNVRAGLTRDLGFSPADRAENIRRVGEVCRLMHDAGLIVLCAFISPYRTDRDAVRGLHPPDGFAEVYVDTPLHVCEARDVHGLYARARSGEIAMFSGVSAPYEAPIAPEVRLDTSRLGVEAGVRRITAHLRDHGVLRTRADAPGRGRTRSVPR